MIDYIPNVYPEYVTWTAQTNMINLQIVDERSINLTMSSVLIKHL